MEREKAYKDGPSTSCRVKILEGPCFDMEFPLFDGVISSLFFASFYFCIIFCFLFYFISLFCLCFYISLYCLKKGSV